MNMNKYNRWYIKNVIKNNILYSKDYGKILMIKINLILK